MSYLFIMTLKITSNHLPFTGKPPWQILTCWKISDFPLLRMLNFIRVSLYNDLKTLLRTSIRNSIALFIACAMHWMRTMSVVCRQQELEDILWSSSCDEKMYLNTKIIPLGRHAEVDMTLHIFSLLLKFR